MTATLHSETLADLVDAITVAIAFEIEEHDWKNAKGQPITFYRTEFARKVWKPIIYEMISAYLLTRMEDECVEE